VLTVVGMTNGRAGIPEKNPGGAGETRQTRLYRSLIEKLKRIKVKLQDLEQRDDVSIAEAAERACGQAADDFLAELSVQQRQAKKK
jgi:hypothetical protein